LVDNAYLKLEKKQLDLIVANDARRAMGAETNQVTLINAAGEVESWPEASKTVIAERLMDRVTSLIGRKG
jgi:phosphopantothenoylcysteine decarboxylase/phosphopantothenate--cysteine ligase